MAKKSTVLIIKSDYTTCYEKLSEAIEICTPIDIGNKKRIVIKINMCDARTPDTGAITHPVFLDALLNYLRDKFGDIEICVVESDATVVLADDFIRWFGFIPILEKWNAKWVNLSKIKSRTVKIKGRHLIEIPLPVVMEDSFLITLPKLKTNTMSSITCCLKNQFGCLPTIDKGQYHPVLDDVIADVNTVYRSDYCIVDGIIAHAGTQGPAFGTPIPANLIICGTDPVAVDATCARIMGFNPWFIGHIRKAKISRIGSMKAMLVGEKRSNLKINWEIKHLDMALFKLAVNTNMSIQKNLRTGWAK